MLMRDKNCWMH